MKFQKTRKIFSAVLSAAIALTSNCCHATLYKYRLSRRVDDIPSDLGISEFFFTTNGSEKDVCEILDKRLKQKEKTYKKFHDFYNPGKIAEQRSVQVWIFDYEKFGDGERPNKWNLISVLCASWQPDVLMYVPTLNYFTDDPDLMERFRTVLLSETPCAMAKKLDGDLPTTLKPVFIPAVSDPQYFDRDYDFATDGSHAYYIGGHGGPDESWYNDDGDDDLDLLDASLTNCIYKIRNLHCYLRAYRIKRAQTLQAYADADNRYAERQRQREAAEEKARKEKEREAAEKKATNNTATAPARSDCKSTTYAQQNVPGTYYAQAPLNTQPTFITTPQLGCFPQVQQNVSGTYYAQAPLNTQSTYIATPQLGCFPQVQQNVMGTYYAQSPLNTQPTFIATPQLGCFPQVQQNVMGTYYAQAPLNTQPTYIATPQSGYFMPAQQNFGYTPVQTPFYGQQQTPYYK